MTRRTILSFAVCCCSLSAFAGNGLQDNYLSKVSLFAEGSHASRFNIKLQPAIYWSSLGLEAEYVISPKISAAINVIGKISGTNGKHAVKNNIELNENFFETGYMAEIIGRYYISLSKKNLTLAPHGLYVQAALGFSKLLYYDGSTRPFSLNTRHPNYFDSYGNTYFSKPSPLIGGIGAGYQVELLPNRVIANILLGSQVNSDSKGVFFTFYASPSVGLMF